MMWAFLSIALVEAIVVHLLVAMWSLGFAVVLSVISLAAVVSLVRMIRSFRRLPIVLNGETLTMRCGTMRSITTPTVNISGLRESWSADALKGRRVLKLSLLAYPNVVVDLIEPVAFGRRVVETIAHRLDQPHEFTAELRKQLA